MDPKLEILVQEHNRCGEAPLWDAARGCLLWTDIDGGLVYQWERSTGIKKVLSRGLNVSGIALNRTGGLIFAGGTGFHLWHKQDHYSSLCSEHEMQMLCFNDIRADSKGRVYAGTIYWGPQGMEKPGKLYLLEKNCSPRVVEEGIELSNGLGFSPDNRILYYADSAVRRIYAYSVEPQSGALSQKRIFVQVPATEGIPDGLTVDAAGFVWCAQWYGSQVVRYDPEGRVERRIALPVQQVSSVAFGGPDLTELYITSAADSWNSPLAPPGYDFMASNMGGSLYRLRLDIRGKQEPLADF